MIKPGTYDAMCIEAAWCKTRNKGSDYVGAVFEVFDAEGASLGQIAGELYWTENTKDRTVKSLKAIGWGRKTGENGELLGPFLTTKIGVKEEEYNGETSSRVNWIGEPPWGASLKAKDKLTLSQAKRVQDEVLAAMGAQF